MIKWEVLLNAGADYMSFADSFYSDDIFLSHEHEENTGYVFTAITPHLDGLPTRQRAYQRASSLMLLLDGARRLNAGRFRFPAFTVASVEPLSGRIEYGGDVPEIEEYPFMDPSIALPTSHAGYERLFASRLISVSKVDEDVRSTLFFAGMLSIDTPKERILSWATLYRMVDASRFIAKRLGLKYEEFVDERRLNQFTAACNNMAVLGLEARHGPSANPPPKNVMTSFDEATELVLGFTSNVLLRHLDVCHPASKQFS